MRSYQEDVASFLERWTLRYTESLEFNSHAMTFIKRLHRIHIVHFIVSNYGHDFETPILMGIP
jgi:hypothetical protein